MARVSSGAAADVDALTVAGTASQARVRPLERPRASVVIPAFNAAATLDETLESLAAQSIDDWEAVVIDDGSTDGTARVAEVWSGKDPRVRLLRQANGGVSRARNAGIESARGDWLFFLDADDWLHPRALEHFLSAVEDRPEAGLAYGSLTRVAPDGACDPLFCHERLALDPAGALRHQNHIAVHVLVRRDLVREHGGFDAGLKTNEDWDLWRKLAWKGVGFVRVPEAVTYYRMREGSASMDGRQMLRDALEVLKRNPPLPVGATATHWEDDGFRRTLYAVWCAALEAGAGRDPLSVLGDVDARLVDICEHAVDAADCMFDGVRTGARVPFSQVADEWPRLGPPLERLLDRIAEETRGRDAKRRLLNALEHRVLRETGRSGPVPLTTMMGVAVDLQAPLPTLEPPPGIECLQLRLSAGDAPIGIIQIPVYGPLPARELGAILVRFFHRRSYVRLSRTLRRPRFWAEAAVRAPLAALAAARRPKRLKRALGAALNAAAAAAAGPRTRVSGPTSLTRAAEIMAQERAAAGARPPLRPEPAPAPFPPDQRVEEIPVLMYHRVARVGAAGLARYRLTPEALEAQLQWLTAHGWRTVASRDVAHGLTGWRGFPRRSVLLTFDDAYADFAEEAWPLLKRYGFGAEVFVPTDKVGGTSDWDADYGPPAPLMSWREIEALAAEGVTFGSHLATHARPDGLSSEALLREAARSRAVLEARLGRPVRTIATPHGAWDERIAAVLGLAGYTTVYTTEPGRVRLGDQPRRLKRIEVRGDLGLDAFVESLATAAT